MCERGGGFKRDCSLTHRKDQSHPAQRGRFATVLGSPQTGPRGPHMVHGQRELQTGMLSGLLGRCLLK